MGTARIHDPNDTPPWLGLIRQLGVVETVAALYNHGPATFTQLRTYVELTGDGKITATAVQRLAAWRICRRDTTGTWDQTLAVAGPGDVYQLTEFGHRFAEVMAGWGEVVAEMPADLRRSLRQHQ